MQVFDVCIVGGGAAGVSAALFLSQGGFGGSVLILEKRQKLLTKFEYTANGR
jgi:flavin-dependent dehydrogenase